MLARIHRRDVDIAIVAMLVGLLPTDLFPGFAVLLDLALIATVVLFRLRGKILARPFLDVVAGLCVLPFVLVLIVLIGHLT